MEGLRLIHTIKTLIHMEWQKAEKLVECLSLQQGVNTC